MVLYNLFNKSIAALLLLWCFVVLVAGVQDACPSPEEISPCSYRKFGSGSRVDCEKVNDVTVLRTVLQSLRKLKKLRIQINDSKLDHIPSDLFTGLNATNIFIVNCEMKSFGDVDRSALEGLENTIRELRIDRSFTREPYDLEYLNISGLHAIKEIWITNNYIRTLPDSWFQYGLELLEVLNIDGNSVYKVGARAFANLHQLVSLTFSGNNVGKIERSLLPNPATRLDSLTLRHNMLTYLPDDIFSNMPSLKFVDFSFNMIQHLPESTWFPVWNQLSAVYLTRNFLVCDSGIEWLFPISKPSTTIYGYCREPLHRKGLKLSDLIDIKRGI